MMYPFEIGRMGKGEGERRRPGGIVVRPAQRALGSEGNQSPARRRVFGRMPNTAAGTAALPIPSCGHDIF